MFCNNVSVLCLHAIVTDYVLIGEIAGNKHPVLLLLLSLLFKYLGATLTENGDLDTEMPHKYNQNGKTTGREGTGCSVLSNNTFQGQGESSPLYNTVVRQAIMYDAGTCAVKKARKEVGCGGNEDVNRMSEVTKLGRIPKEIERQRRWEKYPRKCRKVV